MQNKYTCDIGDFGKYGLLRWLFNNTSELTLGINWCLVPDESNNNDGKFINYLIENKNNINEFKSCDSELYCTFASLVKNNKRNLFEIEKNNVLPRKTIYYDEPLLFYSSDNLKTRIKKRNFWINKAFECLRGADIVFFDPDNGLEVQSCGKYSKRSNKYVFYDDLVPYFERGQSLIIYNHRDRKSEDEYIKRILKIHEYILTDTIFFLRFNRFSVRDYIFVLQPKHKELIEENLNSFLITNWARHFKIYKI